MDDVSADLSRQGALHLADVQRLVDLHELDGEEAVEVYERLKKDGVQLDSDEPDTPKRTLREITPEKFRSDSVGLMLRAAGSVPLLSAEDEVRLGRRVHIGKKIEEGASGQRASNETQEQILDGRQAYEQLVLANLRLVVSIARKYQTPGMELSDLIQEGTIGLMRAADKYDHSLGFRFSTYAVWWIRQAIQRGIADKSKLIRLPVYVNEKLQRIKNARNRLTESLGREPDDHEVASELDFDPAEVRAILDISRDPVSLDAPIGDGSGNDLSEVLNLLSADVAETVLTSLTNVQIRQVLSRYSDVQQKHAKGATAFGIEMLKLRYGLNDDRQHTLEEIGTKYGITRERARQILNKTLRDVALQQEVLKVTSESESAGQK